MLEIVQLVAMVVLLVAMTGTVVLVARLLRVVERCERRLSAASWQTGDRETKGGDPSG